MTRIVRKQWWCPEIGLWVNYQTFAWAKHGCWTIAREPWIIIEVQP
jgi:hypothetical protein